MTLVAYNVADDHVDILTDTLSYATSGRYLGRTAKVQLLPPHLRGAMVSQGAGHLSAFWALDLKLRTDDLADFDELDELTREWLPETWEHIHTYKAEPTDSTIVHLGWSPRRGRFVALGYSSMNDFRTQDLTDDWFVTPAPTSSTPPAPTTVAEWVALAKQVREDRALAPIEVPGMKVFIGGEVVLTRLELGRVTQRVVHTFDDTGAEFLEMVRGTLHPDGQLAPCPCGSGVPVVVCHALPDDSPCVCRSGQTFADCCRVDPDTDESRRRIRELAGVRYSRRVRDAVAGTWAAA